MSFLIKLVLFLILPSFFLGFLLFFQKTQHQKAISYDLLTEKPSFESVSSIELNANFDLSLILDAKSLLFQIQEEFSLEKLEKLIKFEVFLQGFHLKFQNYSSISHSLLRIRQKVESLLDNSRNSIENSKECKAFLYGNRSILASFLLEYKGLKADLLIIQANISMIDSKNSFDFNKIKNNFIFF